MKPALRSIFRILIVAGGLAGVIIADSIVRPSNNAVHFKNWEMYRTYPDSSRYVKPFARDSVTPPIYHLFISALVSSNALPIRLSRWPATHSLQGQPFMDRLDDSLYRVVWTQKAILLICLIFLGFSLSLHVPVWYSAGVVIGIYACGLLTSFSNSVLAETLTQAQFFLIAGISVCYITCKRPPWLTVAIGLACASAPDPACRRLRLYSLCVCGSRRCNHASSPCGHVDTDCRFSDIGSPVLRIFPISERHPRAESIEPNAAFRQDGVCRETDRIRRSRPR